MLGKAFFKVLYYSKWAMCRCDEMVDVADSKSAAGDSVPVRVRSPAPKIWDTPTGYPIFLLPVTVKLERSSSLGSEGSAAGGR